MILLPQLHNSQAIALADIPEMTMPDFRAGVLERVRKGRRISSLFGMPDGNEIMLVLVLTNDAQGVLELCRTRVRDSYPALTPDVPQAHWFEREIAEQWGIVPQGHPWLKPIRFHPSYADRDAWGRTKGMPIEPGVTDYFRVEGEEIHEVAVGPVHAGIIEPGHFRFQCHGENVLHLEIELGYQHRGIERALVARASSPCSWRGHPGLASTTPAPSGVQGRDALATQAAPGNRMVPGDRKGETPSPLCSATDPRTAHYMETVAGDTTVGHATAYASVMEALADATPSLRAHALRAIALELERLANHTGDLGALAGDVGYLPTASYCGRLRGDFLNMTALLCGNRFGRGLVRPGGVRFDLTPQTADELLTRLQKTFEAVRNAVNLLWETPSVMSRFDGTGSVSRQDAIRLGLVGPAARASGVGLDVRSDLPCGIYQSHLLPAMSLPTGDVAARAYVRWFEIQKSVEFITDAIRALPSGQIQQQTPPPAKEHLAVALVEGWRGEICHVAVTDDRGRLRHYKITDPSFHNWFGLVIDMGRCLFCTDCIDACPTKAIQFTTEYRLAARAREALIVDTGPAAMVQALDEQTRRLFGRSLKLRQVSAGGCNACEADTSVLNTVVFDLGRFGIQFVASPRHADGLLITGPVSRNMELALRKTYEATPAPKIVIAVGACAISGGLFAGHPEANKGADGIIPVDLYVPGCPPHPISILDGLLRLLGTIR